MNLHYQWRHLMSTHFSVLPTPWEACVRFISINPMTTVVLSRATSHDHAPSPTNAHGSFRISSFILLPLSFLSPRPRATITSFPFSSFKHNYYLNRDQF